MSLDKNGAHGQVRSSALWGTGNRGGDSRSNALWGKGGRGFIACLLVLFATAIPLAAAGKPASSLATYVDPYLLAKAQTQPNALVKVIIQSNRGAGAAQKAFQSASSNDLHVLDAERQEHKFKFVGAVSATLKAKKVLVLAKVPGLTVTFDSQIKLSGTLSSNQLWPTASGVRPLWGSSTTAQTPVIAIVDSGIDKTHPCFGSRVIHREMLSTLAQGSGDDTRGHGTFVAGIAACEAAGYAGAAPQAPLVDIDVMNDEGMARTSDVIAAAEWIYNNRVAKNIRVANFSLHTTMPSNFTKDPLDKAVEKLWFNGVVVVAAAGNYGLSTGPSGVPYAPGNDPFAITVGAVDLEGSVTPNKHDVPLWSAYGYTKDGFRKPELSAAGRYMIGPVPADATLKLAKPDNVVSPTYMRLSGTSFAAPVVAGAAAQLLAQHPSWTPDQVKGALMLKARYVPEEGLTGAAGVGEVNASRAAAVNNPPNPNASLNRFLVSDPASGSRTFDSASWTDAARASASWDSASWADVTWSDASWSSVTWSDVTWSDVSWADVTWSDVLAAEDVSWEDAAESEVGTPTDDYLMTPEEEAAAAADPTLDTPAPTATP